MKTLIIVGHEGMLGSMLVDEALTLGWAIIEDGKDETFQMKIMGRENVKDFNDYNNLDKIPNPSVVVNAAGIVKGRHDRTSYQMVYANSVLPHLIAQHPHVERIIHVSTDCIFDGRKHEPYSEADQPTPVDLYGRSKLAGELLHESNALTVRTSFIGFGKRGLVSWLLAQPENGSIEGYQNWPWNGLYARIVARQLLTLALDTDMTGLLHLEGQVHTKYDILEKLTKVLRPDVTVVPTVSEISRWMLLSSSRISGQSVPSWDKQIDELRADALDFGVGVYR